LFKPLLNKEEYEELYAETPSLEAIAKKLGVSRSKVTDDFKYYGIPYEVSSVNSKYRKMRGIVAPGEGERVIVSPNSKTLNKPIPCGYDPKILQIIEHRVYDEKSVEELWDVVEKYQEVHNGQSTICREVEVVYNNDYVVIVFLGDLHVGSESAELKAIKYHMNEMMKRDNLLLALCGDYEDNFITFAQNQQLIPPSDQHRFLEYIINTIKSKSIGCVRGNHEERTKKVADIDMVERTCKLAKIPYLGAEGRMKVKVKDIEYNIFMAHQSKFESSFNKTNSVKRAFERKGEFDIGVIAHKHEGDIEQTPIWGKQRIFIRPGTYMTYNRWAINEGYGETDICVPAVLLFGKEKMMISFYNLKNALLILDLLQGKVKK